MVVEPQVMHFQDDFKPEAGGSGGEGEGEVDDKSNVLGAGGVDDDDEDYLPLPKSLQKAKRGPKKTGQVGPQKL